MSNRRTTAFLCSTIVALSAGAAQADPMCRAVAAAFSVANALGIAHDTSLERACASGSVEGNAVVAASPAERLRAAVNGATYSPAVIESARPPWMASPPSEPSAWVAVGAGATLNASVWQAATQISAQVNVSISTPGQVTFPGSIDMGSLIVGSAAPQLHVLGQFSDAEGTHALVSLEHASLQQNTNAVANAAYEEMEGALRRFEASLASRRITQTDREMLGQSLAQVGALSRSDVGASGASTWEAFWQYYRRIGERALYCAELTEALFDSEDPLGGKQDVRPGTFPTLVTETRMAGVLRCHNAVLSGVPIDLSLDGGLAVTPRGLRTSSDGRIVVDVSGIHGNGRVTVQLSPSLQELPGRSWISTAGNPNVATAGFTSTRPADYALTVTGTLPQEDAAVRQAVSAFTERRWNARPVRGTSAVLTGTLQVTFAPAVRVSAQYSQPVTAALVFNSSQVRVFERNFRAAALGASPEAARTAALQQLLSTLQRP